MFAGGGQRCQAIAARLQQCDADIIVLQETVCTRGPDLCHVLAKAGYEYCLSAPRGPKDRGLCLLSRVPLTRIYKPLPPQAGVYPRGWLEVEVQPVGWHIAAVYAPAAGPSLPAFWDAAAAWLARRATRPFLMLGDFNAGLSGTDADEYRFKAGPGFAKLAGTGLVDLWRREHGAKLEYTWFSRPGRGLTGRGFRIDHAFASPQLAQHVISCRYDHTVRERGWSDHSLLLVELGTPGNGVTA
jgi:exodeoxyribonuclease III